jgi:SAM-dependent MidA family methyltransferase
VHQKVANHCREGIVVVIDSGSTFHTYRKTESARENTPRLKGLELSR